MISTLGQRPYAGWEAVMTAKNEPCERCKAGLE